MKLSLHLTWFLSLVTGIYSQSNLRAAFMSGEHGIGYRIPGGVNFETHYYNATNFANQIKELPISYVIIGLSSGAFGDRYLAPHSVLTDLNRGSTPIRHTINDGNFPATEDFPIEDYPDLDLFDDILTAMEGINVKVIAYMAAQGPAMLKEGEYAAYDYNNKSPYVDSCAECPILTGDEGCDCAPSVWKWKNYVKANYGDDSSASLHRAYAETIVQEYADRYGRRIAGWWFDQGSPEFSNGELIEQIVHAETANPDAAIGWNHGYKIPLRNNNPGIEDFTSGHMNPLRKDANPSDGCYNYGMVLAAEGSNNGYVYNDFQTFKDGAEIHHNGAATYNYALKSDPSTRPDSFSYDTSQEPSLAHVFMPLNLRWNNGDIVWDKHQGAEWQKRVLQSGGAWTWNVARSGCANCPQKFNPSNGGLNVDEILGRDFDYLKEIYALLSEKTAPWEFTDSNCKCCTTKVSLPEYEWGCRETDGYPVTCDATIGLETDIATIATYAPTPVPAVTMPECDLANEATLSDWYTISKDVHKSCAPWFYNNFERCDSVGSGGSMDNFGSITGYEACPLHCGCCSNSPISNPDAWDKCPSLANLAPEEPVSDNTPDSTPATPPATDPVPETDPAPAPETTPEDTPATEPAADPVTEETGPPPAPVPAPEPAPEESPATEPVTDSVPVPAPEPEEQPATDPVTEETGPVPAPAPVTDPTPEDQPATEPKPDFTPAADDMHWLTDKKIGKHQRRCNVLARHQKFCCYQGSTRGDKVTDVRLGCDACPSACAGYDCSAEACDATMKAIEMEDDRSWVTDEKIGRGQRRCGGLFERSPHLCCNMGTTNGDGVTNPQNGCSACTTSCKDFDCSTCPSASPTVTPQPTSTPTVTPQPTSTPAPTTHKNDMTFRTFEKIGRVQRQCGAFFERRQDKCCTLGNSGGIFNGVDVEYVCEACPESCAGFDCSTCPAKNIDDRSWATNEKIGKAQRRCGALFERSPHYCCNIGTTNGDGVTNPQNGCSACQTSCKDFDCSTCPSAGPTVTPQPTSTPTVTPQPTSTPAPTTHKNDMTFRTFEKIGRVQRKCDAYFERRQDKCCTVGNSGGIFNGVDIEYACEACPESCAGFDCSTCPAKTMDDMSWMTNDRIGKVQRRCGAMFERSPQYCCHMGTTHGDGVTNPQNGCSACQTSCKDFDCSTCPSA